MFLCLLFSSVFFSLDSSALGQLLLLLLLHSTQSRAGAALSSAKAARIMCLLGRLFVLVQVSWLRLNRHGVPEKDNKQTENTTPSEVRAESV